LSARDAVIAYLKDAMTEKHLGSLQRVERALLPTPVWVVVEL